MLHITLGGFGGSTGRKIKSILVWTVNLSIGSNDVFCTTRGMVQILQTMNLMFSMVTSFLQQEFHLPVETNQKVVLLSHLNGLLLFLSILSILKSSSPITLEYHLPTSLFCRICCHYFFFLFVCEGLLTCVWFYFYRICLTILAQSIYFNINSILIYIDFLFHNIKNANKRSQVFPQGRFQSRTSSSLVGTLARWS